MKNPVLQFAIDSQPSAVVRMVQLLHGPPPVTLPLGDSNAMLLMCADGAMLTARYMTTSELFDLLRTSRLIPTMLQLRERSAWPYLLLSGLTQPTGSGKVMHNGTPSGLAWSAMQGALLSIQELGVGVLTLQSDRYIADTLFTLANRDRSTRRVRPPRDALFVTPAEDMLLALPGIGEDRLAQLLRFTNGSVAAAIDALTDPRCDVPGIGPETKKKVRQALGLSDQTRLALFGMSDEDALFPEETNGNEPHTTIDGALVAA
jgi:hypothetical protein